MIYRKATRVLLNADGVGTPTEITKSTKDLDSSVVTIAVESGGYLYLGSHAPFTTRHFSFGTANTQAGTLTVEFYKDSTTWTAVEDLVDQTDHFTADGFVSWQNPGTWTTHELSPVSDVELYWLRIQPSVNLDAGTTLTGVVNLFCSLDDVKDIYPHLINDANWLPSGVTSRLPLLLKATDETVRRLKKNHVIVDESQVLDINEVMMACVHAYAYLAYLPRAHSNEEAMDRMKVARDAMEDAIENTTFSVDQDESGTIDYDEEDRHGIQYSPR
jgi:hypothetical protein